MSWEAWGSGDDGPDRWEETAMCKDFQKVRAAFQKWQTTYQNEMPGPEFTTAALTAEAALDELSLMMEGKIND
jgi:hypothetical protein